MLSRAWWRCWTDEKRAAPCRDTDRPWSPCGGRSINRERQVTVRADVEIVPTGLAHNLAYYCGRLLLAKFSQSSNSWHLAGPWPGLPGFPVTEGLAGKRPAGHRPESVRGLTVFSGLRSSNSLFRERGFRCSKLAGHDGLILAESGLLDRSRRCHQRSGAGRDRSMSCRVVSGRRRMRLVHFPAALRSHEHIDAARHLLLRLFEVVRVRATAQAYVALDRASRGQRRRGIVQSGLSIHGVDAGGASHQSQRPT